MVAAVTTALLALSGAVIATGPAHAADFALQGHLTGADTHAGIPNLSVSIFNTTTSQQVFTTTDANGDYSFATVPSAGQYTLNVNTQYALGGYVGGYYPSMTPFYSTAGSLSLSNTSNLTISFELARGHSIMGHVTFSGAPSPVAVNVFLFDSGTYVWTTVAFGATNGEGLYNIPGLAPGSYLVQFSDVASTPVYRYEYYDDARDQEHADPVVVATADVTGIDAELTPSGPLEVERLAGGDRFQTSVRISQEYSYSDVVFVANGLDYPDALSAAAAAGRLGAPLLLTRPNALPAEVKAEIIRLNPILIFVVGGSGVVSDAVFAELAPLADDVQRLWGSDRYATSKAVFGAAWEGADALTAFLVDGRNFPDALASASAAGRLGGPVLLVKGGSTTAPAGLGPLFQQFNTEHLRIAGGTAVVSSGIEATASAYPGIADVTRYWGANRYATSISINRGTFTFASTVYLAVGTGYADALSGAALAGSAGQPLYLVPSNCVPTPVLEDITALGASHIVLLGGTGVLSAAVEALTPCTS
jgi:putative cell wall-binding protein